MSLWTLAEIARATGGRAERDGTVGGVAIDNREVSPGDLFVALRGPSNDGHRFVAAAFAAGAAAALVAERPEVVPPEAPLVVVDDTMPALEALGRAGRARFRGRAAAVTGSVGKTSVKEALRHVLAEQGGTHASAKSHNNHWGVPLTLARLPADAAYAVLELGMNRAGELTRLSSQARPHVAVITRIAPAHYEFFGSLEAIADAKAEIFTGLEPGGVAVLNRDDPQFSRLAAATRGARIVTFGVDPASDLRRLDATSDGKGSEATLRTPGGRVLRFAVPQPGAHVVENAMATLATVHALGADVAVAAARLATLPALPGRGRRLNVVLPDGGRALLLDDSYNANPASMAAGIAVLAGYRDRRRVAALGDMLELGEAAPSFHEALAERLIEADVARVLTAGPLMRHLHDVLPPERRGGHADTADALAPALRAELRDGDVLLIKGSLGSRVSCLVDLLADHP